MSSAPVRRISLEALVRWDKGTHFAEAIIDDLSKRHSLETRDRAFLSELVLGVLRNLTLLDYHIEALRKGRLRPRLRWILRLGLYQLFQLRVPDHAAVSETVGLAANKAERGLANAVLRRAARERTDFTAAEASLPPAIRYSMPEFIVDRWTTAFGDEATLSLCQWMNQPPPLYVRRNRLINASGAPALPTDCPTSQDDRFFECQGDLLEWINSGQGYVQDPSTAAACDLLAPAPGERVLDACAAPGGKTGLLAEMMNNEGEIVACDVSAPRLKRVESNLARLGVGIATFVEVDWEKLTTPLTSPLADPFDAILIDAPCTNTGAMRRRVDVRWRLRPEEFDLMAERQSLILSAALPLLRPGGRLVYSTCSLETEENEGVVERLLAGHPEIRQVESAQRLPFRDAVDGAYAALLTR